MPAGLFWRLRTNTSCAHIHPPSHTPSGLKDPDGVLALRLKLAHTRAACQAGDTSRALTLLREMSEGLTTTALSSASAAAAAVLGGSGEPSDEEKGLLQLLLGDVQYQVSRPLVMSIDTLHHSVVWWLRQQ